jgi:hypothetical protein
MRAHGKPVIDAASTNRLLRERERGRERARWEMICLRRGSGTIRMPLRAVLCNRFCHAILAGRSTRRWSAGHIAGLVIQRPR